jgi:predicted DCC family thiol-disulfide oxidoreductase YuxK
MRIEVLRDYLCMDSPERHVSVFRHLNLEITMILLFDGYCMLCSRAVRFILAHDRKGRVRFAALQSKQGLMLIKELNLPVDQVDSVILVEGNQFYMKSIAVLRVLRQLDGWSRILALFIILPRPLRDFIYDVIARKRYRIFGRRDSCLVPPEAMKERFLQ